MAVVRLTSASDIRKTTNEEGKGGGEGKRRSWKKVGKWVREEEEVVKITTTCASDC